MAKPEVPTGPIPMDGKPDPVSIKSLKANIATLAATDLDAIQKLVDQKEWPKAINALDAVSAQAKRVQNSAGRVASRASRQHWSPLLEGLADDGN